MGQGGGAIHNFGTLMLSNSTITGNQSLNAGGGGISNDNGGSLTGGTMIIVNSTVSNNQTVGSGNLAPGPGGGVFNSGISLTIVNSTISGNKTGDAGSSDGGGIDNFKGTVSLISSTVAANQAGSGGDGGGIRNNPNFGGVTNLQNTLVANNTGGAANSSPDLFGPFGSRDFNLIGNASGAAFSGTVTHNITTINARLGPLANNGGPTMTHALSAGSLAIDAGSSAPAVDQNGIALPTHPRWLNC